MKLAASSYLSQPGSDCLLVHDPISREQWADINRLGIIVDRRIVANDLRLTQGGEPTFVSRNDYESAEWRSAAESPTKFKLGEALLRKLRDRFAATGIMQFGLGKLYPQESAPRWALSLSWRTDGLPLWHDDTLFESESFGPSPTIDDAKVLCGAIANNLRLSREYCLSAFEELPYVYVGGKKYPIDISGFDPSLLDPSGATEFQEHKDKFGNRPAAIVLPLRVQKNKNGQKTWVSERWNSEVDNFFLLSSDAPAGLRLPLDSLNELSPDQYPNVFPIDPSKAPEELSRSDKILENYISRKTPEELVRTALVVEPRSGRLFVFLPPISDAEDFASLIAAIEDAVKEHNVPVCFEGYLPPLDPRLTLLTVTPDPGVLEINIHPAKNWNELVGIITGIYEEAIACGLTTRKYNFDGRLIGTGGGSHIVVGAGRPIDSPFLRNPAFLESIIKYWQNHPSLSYLFSGLFIGSTSQAPRIDEARQESLEELDIAFGQIPEARLGELSLDELGGLFKNLLVDHSGNRHRAEICVDKLWGDAGRMNRLGLVEFRGFEMSPSASMSLLQHLLVRSIIVKLWEVPYRRQLIRWGSELHNKFMLPYFIWQDFVSVLDDLKHADMVFDSEWYKPHFEFRFPLIYSHNFGKCELEVRHALEPWNVVGGDDSADSTTRPVDYSLERLQITIKNYDRNCQLVTCNDAPLELFETEGKNIAVSGIRFCARQLNESLHPAIKVNAPLRIEVYDRQFGGRLGGCIYHVTPDGETDYESFPGSDSEAADRCRERLDIIPPLPHKMPSHDGRTVQNNPFTLDLRSVRF